MMKKVFYGILAALCFLNLCAAEVVLVRDGKPLSEIVLPEKPTRSEQMAAFELQHLIHLMTGAKLSIVQTPRAGMLPIRLGPVSGEKFTGEQYKVSVRPEGIFLAGNDTQDFGKVDYQNPRTYPGTGYNVRNPMHAYNYHSTLLAAYDFLENSCGMRFYSFGDEGVAFVPRKTLAVQTVEKKFEPKTKGSRYAGVAHRDSVRVTTEKERWLLQLRWRMNTVYGEVNHTVYSLLYRYWGPARGYEKLFIEKRPQYFTQGYEKMPVDRHFAPLFSPSDPPPSQICTTNPDVIKYFASEAQSVYESAVLKKKQRPNGVRFRYLCPMEGKPYYYPVQENDNEVFCRCPECMKLFPQINEFDRQAYVHFDFINRVSREAKKINPKLNIATLAYNKCMIYPDPRILKLDPGILIQICLGVHAWMHPQIYNRQHGIYKQWVKNEGKNRPLTVWTYILSPDDEARRSYNYRNFPMLFPWQAGRIYKEFMDDGIQGVFIELCTKVNLLEGYVAIRLAFDPSQDYNQIIDEYFRMYYGEVAEPMKEFYREVEKITWNPKNYPAKDVDAYVKRWKWGSVGIGIHTQKVNWTLGTHERMAKLQKIVDKIKADVKTPVVKKRVDIFLKDIWDRAVQGRKEYDQRLLVEKEPPPRYSAAWLPDQAKQEKPDFSRVDWANIPAAGNWVDLKTRKNTENSPQVKMAFTERHVLIRYEESGRAPFSGDKKDLWTEGVEIFFGKQGDYPFDHYAVGVNGKTAGYRHTLHDGARMLEPLKMSDILIADHEVKADSWSFVLALPRRNTPLAGDGVKRFNFIRNRASGQPAAWSYLAPVDYASSVFRMGYVQLPENGKTADFTLPGGFGKRKNGRANWMQNTPPLKEGSAVTISDGKAVLYSDRSLVHFMTLISPLVRYGDQVVCEFTASGEGKGGVGLYLYAASGRMDSRYCGSTAQFFKATEKPVRYRFVIDTGKLAPKFRNIVRVKPYLIAQKDAKITFSEVKFSLLPKDANKK